MKTASVGRRFAALAINVVLGAVVYGAFVFCNVQGLSFPLGLILAGWLLFALFAAIFGGTPGDVVMGVHLVDLNRGAKIKIVRASFRSLFSLFSICLCGMGYALMFLHFRRQALHDLLTNTIAVESTGQIAPEDLKPQATGRQ